MEDIQVVENIEEVESEGEVMVVIHLLGGKKR